MKLQVHFLRLSRDSEIVLACSSVLNGVGIRMKSNLKKLLDVRMAFSPVVVVMNLYIYGVKKNGEELEETI